MKPENNELLALMQKCGANVLVIGKTAALTLDEATLDAIRAVTTDKIEAMIKAHFSAIAYMQEDAKRFKTYKADARRFVAFVEAALASDETFLEVLGEIGDDPTLDIVRVAFDCAIAATAKVKP